MGQSLCSLVGVKNKSRPCVKKESIENRAHKLTVAFDTPAFPVYEFRLG